MTNPNKVRSYTDKELLERVKSLDNFTAIPEGFWILGVRSNEDTFDTYDDKFYIFKGEVFQDVLTGTTNPGGKILKGGFLSFNKVGAAVLKSDIWHYDMWKPVYRSARGYELRQYSNTYVYRDGDMDEKSEEIGEPIFGNYGINFHTNTFKYYNSVVNLVIGSWSAGCQVTNQRDHFLRWVKFFKTRYDEHKQNTVSYCLINEF